MVVVRTQLRIAVEDRFILIRLREDKALLPDGRLLAEVADALSGFARTSNYDILCDWAGLKYVTEDVKEAVDFICNLNGGRIVARNSDLELIQETFYKTPSILRVKSSPTYLNYRNLDLEKLDQRNYFDHLIEFRSLSREEDGQTIELKGSEDEAQMDAWYDSGFEIDRTNLDDLKDQYLQSFVARLGRNSLLTEFVIQENDSHISVTPYHAHAHYPLELNEQLIVGRPGVIAKKTGSLLKPEITEFEKRLNTSSLRESQVQSFLEQHPNILKMLGYGYNRIYPQVILQREDGTALRPDFILEPVGSSWCDILDIKLPDKSIVVGGRDRKRFSSEVEELVAQLREYAAYFEDSDLANRVEEKYGIKCYKPRLIGIIGRDPFISDERQFRRLQTKYSDVDVLTFDRLLKLIKSRPLI